MYRTAEFNKTTVRLLAEFIEKTGQNATIVNMDSFLEFFAYLNPTAPIPTVPEIEKQLLLKSPIRCIVCGMETESDSAVTLSIDNASIILTATVIGYCRDPSDAVNQIRKESLRACTKHFNSIFHVIFEGLQIENTYCAHHAKYSLANRWCKVYTMIRSSLGEQFTKFDVRNFKSILQSFLDTFGEIDDDKKDKESSHFDECFEEMDSENVEIKMESPQEEAAEKSKFSENLVEVKLEPIETHELDKTISDFSSSDIIDSSQKLQQNGFPEKVEQMDKYSNKLKDEASDKKYEKPGKKDYVEEEGYWAPITDSEDDEA